MIFGYNYWGQWYTLTLGVTLACGYVFVISCLAAALLPYPGQGAVRGVAGRQVHARRLPARHPLRCHRVHLRPRPRSSCSSPTPATASTGDALLYIVVGGIFLVCLVGYWIGRAYNKGKGIDVNYAFLEVPPE